MEIRAELFKKYGKNTHIALYTTTICFLNSTIEIPQMLIAQIDTKKQGEITWQRKR
jgi:hypothetical protein